MSNPKPRIVRKGDYKGELTVPHEGWEVTFVYPPFGPDTYRNVGAEILKNGYSVPTAEETASLLYEAYHLDMKGEPGFQK